MWLATGADTGPDRFVMGLTTTGGAYGTGTNTGDSSFQAKSGGNMTFATAASGTQIVRASISPAGDFTMASGDLITNAAAKTL